MDKVAGVWYRDGTFVYILHEVKQGHKTRLVNKFSFNIQGQDVGKVEAENLASKIVNFLNSELPTPDHEFDNPSDPVGSSCRKCGLKRGRHPEFR